MKLWAELTTSLHQPNKASITETGLGRLVRALSCRGSRLVLKQLRIYKHYEFRAVEWIILTFLLLISGSAGWLEHPVLQASCSSNLLYASWHAAYTQKCLFTPLSNSVKYKNTPYNPLLMLISIADKLHICATSPGLTSLAFLLAVVEACISIHKLANRIEPAAPVACIHYGVLQAHELRKV